jgi:hypothetical protein
MLKPASVLVYVCQLSDTAAGAGVATDAGVDAGVGVAAGAGVQAAASNSPMDNVKTMRVFMA